MQANIEYIYYRFNFSDNTEFINCFNTDNNIQNNESFLVKNGAQVTLIAGNKIVLNPGFKVELSGDFNAGIEPCNE